jgi:hypothetical protein
MLLPPQAVALMHESGLSLCLTSTQHQELVEIIRSLILATDISRQQVSIFYQKIF